MRKWTDNTRRIPLRAAIFSLFMLATAIACIIGFMQDTSSYGWLVAAGVAVCLMILEWVMVYNDEEES